MLRRNVEEPVIIDVDQHVDVDQNVATHENGHITGAQRESSATIRPISYHECCGEGEVSRTLPNYCVVHNGRPKSMIRKCHSTVLAVQSTDAIVCTCRPSRRRSKPVAILQVILRKFRPKRRSHKNSDAESLAMQGGCRWTCEDCNSRDYSNCVMNTQEDRSSVAIAQVNSSRISRGHQLCGLCGLNKECGCLSQDQAIVSIERDLYPSSVENSLTLAELSLNGVKDEAESLRGNNLNPDRNFSSNASEITSSNVSALCNFSNNGKSSIVEINNDREDQGGAGVIIATDLSPEEQLPSRWTLAQELNRLSRYGWYWGPVSREEAEDKLADQPEGAFLVRDSTDDRYLFSLSFRSSGRTLHSRVEYCNGEFSFYAQPQSDSYRSMVDLIERCVADSQSGIYCYSRGGPNVPTGGGHPSYPVKLTRPVSRFSQVRTLQYLCRFVIRQHTRIDHIQSLPLPVSVKGWLKENQY